MKVPNLKPVTASVFFFALACERIFIKTRSTESRCVIGLCVWRGSWGGSGGRKDARSINDITLNMLHDFNRVSATNMDTRKITFVEISSMFVNNLVLRSCQPNRGMHAL